MNYFNSKNIVITGAANGLGKELAIRISSCAKKVYILDLDSEGLQLTKKMCKSFSACIEIIVVDLSNKEESLSKMNEISKMMI